MQNNRQYGFIDQLGLLSIALLLPSVLTGCVLPHGRSPDIVPVVEIGYEEAATTNDLGALSAGPLDVDDSVLAPEPRRVVDQTQEPSRPQASSETSNLQWQEVSELLHPRYDMSRPLESEECYVQAMAATGLGHLIDLERQLHQCLKTTKRNATQKRIVDRLLCFRAEQERNRAAGASLKAFYNLAEIESQKRLLERTSQTTEQLANAAKGVKDSGINAKIDMLGIELQELEVKRRYSELQTNEGKLQFNLRRLIGEAPGAPVQLVPLVDLQIDAYPGSREEAVATAIECRAELKALNYLISLNSKDSLPSSRQQLRTTDPSLGSSIPVATCLKLVAILFSHNESHIEMCFRVKQLHELRAETLKLIEVEVSAAHFDVCHRLQLIALAKSEAAKRANYIEQLEAARLTDNYQYQDLADARIRLLAAESAVIHEIHALKADQAKLVRTQGLYCE